MWYLLQGVCLQLYLSRVFVLLQHVSSFEKIQTISEQIASIINHDCHCQISAAYITAATFSCDPQETTGVIFRAKLSSTSKVRATNMTSLVHKWIISGSASLTIEHVHLVVDPACNVLINSFSDHICSPAPVVTYSTPTVTVEGVSATSNIIGTLIGTVLVAIIVILVVICALHIFKNRRQLNKYIPRLVL